MSTDIKKIRKIADLVKAGARNNKYRIFVNTNTDLINSDEALDILCKSASFPGQEINTVEVFVKGRKLQLAAEITGEGTWEIEMYNDPNLKMRTFFLEYIQDIHGYYTPQYLDGSGPKGNVKGFIKNDKVWYLQDVTVEQLDHEGEVVKKAKLHNCYPTTVGPIEYTDETGDVSTSSVTFTFSGISYE